ncbi:MAG: oligoendopeptidase F [Candidatus Hydrogenedentes bacterium]|nr:oligoendopeptidase F [Candidatus Hydrogenedentota bacterium]
MATVKRSPLRRDIKKEDTWDLSPLFKDDKAWDAAYRKLDKQIAGFEKFRGKLGSSAKTLRDCYAFEIEFDKLAETMRSYAFLKSSEDVANSTYQGMVARYTHLATHAMEAASFIAPEIQAIPKKKMDAFLKDPVLKDYRYALEKLLRYRPHILSEPEEMVLAMQGEVAGTASKVFGQLNDADLKFGFVTDEKGRKVELTHGSLITFYESPKRTVRKEAFHKFYDAYEAHSNTLAATLSSSVLNDVYHARVRHYPSVREASLFHDKVPVAVYDNLIKAVHANLKTVYRYLEVRRKALKIKDVHIYDCYVPLAHLGKSGMPYAKAADSVCAALAPLGDGYCKALHEGLVRGRWVDRYENQGKRSGAFSAGGYSGPPYILMNYKDDVIDSAFTLAHEAGHSMHTYYSVRNQPYQYYDYTIFVAEVASTFNELLLGKYLFDHAKDKKMRAFLINRELDEIRNTLVRQTMFAEFEHITHAITENGEPLTIERIRHEYRGLLERYFGPEFCLDEQLTLEGLRIPHFYNAFYVYKYATGISAAVALSERVLNGGAKEREAYLSFLKGGGSKFPLELLRDAGVDMEKPGPVATAMKRFARLVDELEELL